jgi:outer membrane protein assembly factor BamD
MRPALFIILAVFAAAILSGCAHEGDAIKPAQELYDEGARLAVKGDVEKAADTFMQVRTYYPGHDLARRALLATADLYYDKEEYEEALKNYQEFRLLYPTDPEAGYSLYRIGMCYYKQLGTFDRDQSETTRAIQSFAAFISTYPNSPHVEDAAARQKEARALLAQHNLSIGKFYLKKGNAPAACNRFQAVKAQYPDVQFEDDLDALILKACSSGVNASKD